MTEQTRRPPSGAGAPFHASKHALFCFRSLKFLPSPYQAEEQIRMTLAYFCLSSLSLLPSTCLSPTNDPSLSALDVLLKPEQRQGYIDWVYEQQSPGGGFRGGDSMAAVGLRSSEIHQLSSEEPVDSSITLVPLSSQRDQDDFDRLMDYPDSDSNSDSGEETTSKALPPPQPQLEHPLAPANLIQTYTALLILAILKDDFSRLDRNALLRFIARCQIGDGSFLQFPSCPEAGDPRSTYAAFVLASLLNDWSSIDVERALAFLITCQRPDGGFATRPGSEAQGGTTYCSIACFSLSSQLPSLPNPQDLLRSLIGKQVAPVPTPPSTASSSSSDDADDDESTPTPTFTADSTPRPSAGFQGRLGKPPDACYSFWTVASVALLDPSFEEPEKAKRLGPNPALRKWWYDASMDREWLLTCQHEVHGGFGREPCAMPDVYHTYLSLAALSLGSSPTRSNKNESLEVSLGLAPLDPGWNCSTKVKNYLLHQARLQGR